MLARFHPLCLSLALLGLLAACQSPAEAPPRVQEPYAFANYLQGSTGPAIEVQVRALTPYQQVERIALVDPNGRRFSARQILHTRYENGAYPPSTGSQPSVGVHGGGGSGGGFFGVGVGVPLGGGSTAPPPSAGDEAMARFILDDPQWYRETVAGWRVEVFISEAGGRSGTIELPAPPP